MPRLDQLPREILQAISDHLGPLSVGRLGQTSRRINGALQVPLVRAAKEYALPGEAEYKQRITFKEDGKGIRSRRGTQRLSPQPLVQAIRQHQFNKVKIFLEAGVDPNAYDLDGNRMLSHAVRVQDGPIVDLLLEHGADPSLNDVQAFGRTLYYNAATTIKHLDVLMFLIEKYPEQLSPETGKKALQLALDHGSAESVKTLITAGIGFVDDIALHAAIAGRCSLDVIKLAIDKGADFRLTSRDGRTMIHEAATNIYHPDVLGFLIGKYPELLSSRSTMGRTALWSAIHEGSAELAKILITAGIDMNVRDHTGKTALHAALEFNERAVHENVDCDGQEIADRCISIATALLEHGIHVGIADEWGLTELHHAVQENKHWWSHEHMPSVIRLLLSRSTVDVNATNNSGSTPLHLAAKAGSLPVVRVLVDEGNADVNKNDYYGQRPVDLARAFPAVVRYLSRRAATGFTFV